MVGDIKKRMLLIASDILASVVPSCEKSGLNRHLLFFAMADVAEKWMSLIRQDISALVA
jgi:hypothetical protein